MKWLKRVLWQWTQQGRCLDEEQDLGMPSTLSNKRGTVRQRDSYESDDGLNMQVFKAIGGKIITFRSYDRKSDRNYSTVYIITDEQDFERELGKMITMESMKQ